MLGHHAISENPISAIDSSSAVDSGIISDAVGLLDGATLTVHRCAPNVFASAIRNRLITDIQHGGDALAQFGSVHAVGPADTVTLLDGATLTIHRCTPNVLVSAVRNRLATDAQDISDRAYRLQTARHTDRVDVSDSASILAIVNTQQRTISDAVDVADGATLTIHRCTTNVLISTVRQRTSTDVQDVSDETRRLRLLRRDDQVIVVDSLSLTATVVSSTITQVVTDRQDLSDRTRLVHYRVFADRQIVADSVATQLFGFTQVATDRQDLSDRTRFVHYRVFADRQTVADSVATQTFGSQIAVPDSVTLTDTFLTSLLRVVGATDMQTFTDQVMLHLLTRELRFFDEFPIHDDVFVTTFAESLEALMAGIRTFTCTPGFAIQREAMTKTSVVEFDQSGIFAMFGRSSRPTYKFTVPIRALTKIQVDSLNAWHMFHQGGKAFFWDGGFYGYVSSLNLVGEGNGSRTDFYLPNRHIDPNSISIGIFNGTTTSITTAFSLYATAGMISLATAPLSGHDVMASHAHKYKVVFEPDGLKVQEIYSGIFQAELMLREILL